MQGRDGRPHPCMFESVDKVARVGVSGTPVPAEPLSSDRAVALNTGKQSVGQRHRAGGAGLRGPPGSLARQEVSAWSF